MIRPIPTLEDYGLTAKHGFLPSDTPVTELPAYFAEWESVVKNLQALILTGRLRESIARMPVLSTDRLSSAAEWRRAYSILGFMLHGYIWGGEKAADVSINSTIPTLYRHIYILTDQGNSTIPFNPPPQHLRIPRAPSRSNLRRRMSLELQAPLPQRTSRLPRKSSHPLHLHRLPGRAMVLPRLRRHRSPRRRIHPRHAQCHLRRPRR